MTLIRISNVPLVEIGSKENPKFPGKESTFIRVQTDEKNELCIHSGYVYDGFVINLIKELNDLMAHKIDTVGYGGSEGDFSVTFTVTRESFSLDVHNFGEPFNYYGHWPINFELQIMS
jgi:hypothetical protein